jgi:hypothetical protein
LGLTATAHDLATDIQQARTRMEQGLRETLGDERARLLLDLLNDLAAHAP